jgi:cation diffusion facilitator family transporter
VSRTIAGDRASENREKRAVALSSVLAGLGLTLLKGVGGWMTGSLGILAETAHSALDLGAAALTYFAVRASARPPDEDHNYGHQRFENLSALAETLLLLITCGWIVYEAVRRLFFAEVHVGVSWFAFFVVDFTRSRALKRAAVKYKSQALEADALHFSTDMASSAVVIVGLALVAAGKVLEMESLFQRADALAALGVAAIVIVLSLKLGRESVDILLDRAPEGLRDAIRRAALEVPGVLECRKVRVRRSGGDAFADLVIVTHGAASVETAHRAADTVEEHIRHLFPRTDVVVHVEPSSTWADPGSAVRGLAARRGFTIHDLLIHRGEGGTAVDLHAEVPQGLRLGEAHRLVAPLEEDIKREISGVTRVNLHLDPIDAGTVAGEDDPLSLELIAPFVQETLASLPEIRGIHDLLVRRDGRRLYVSLHAVFDGNAPLEAVHRAAESLEARLRRRFPEILRVLVHTEPQPSPG